MDTIFFGDRFDFLHLGLASTNKSAAVLACALVSSGFMWSRSKGAWQTIGFCVGFIIAILLVATKSRGGIIAALGGLGLMISLTRPSLSKRELFIVLCFVGLVVAYGSIRGSLGRFAYGDESRTKLWSAGLSMLWDFKAGVGRGQTPQIYTQWYQEVGDGRRYLSLISFHLTWLAERGIAGRIFYVLFWAVIGWVIWPRRECLILSVGAAIWVTFFIAATFSTTATHWTVWVIPIFWLLVIVIRRSVVCDWRGLRLFSLLAGCGLVVLLILHLSGWYASDPKLFVDSGVGIKYGYGRARVVVFDPRPDILGAQWGHEIREQSETVVVSYDRNFGYRENALGTWILSGTVPSKVPLHSRIVVYNMIGTKELLDWLTNQSASSVEVFLSGYLWDELRGDDWSIWSDKNSANLRRLNGANLYVSGWLRQSGSD